MRRGRHYEYCPAAEIQRAQKYDAEGHNYGDQCRENAMQLTEERARVIPPRFRTAMTDETLGDDGLYFWGDVGTGKTYRAAALALQAIHHGIAIQWVTGSAWLAAIRTSFNGGDTPATPEELTRCDLLVIDDLGAEKPSEWAIEQLFTLVNLAYENDVQLIVTSNLRLSTLDKKLGKRITSRLAEMCEAVAVTGQDRRLVTAMDRKAAHE